MTSKHHDASHGSTPVHLPGHTVPPADSEIPLAEPPPTTDEVLPNPGEAGGLTNIPEELLPESDQLSDLLDHSGLDTELPNEDHAPDQPNSEKPPETWGHL